MEQKILAIGGGLLSLGFTYIPGLNTWYEKLEKTQKQLVMLVILSVATLALFGLSCADILPFTACDKDGAVEIAFAFISAIVANQGVHSITPKKSE